MVSMYFSRYFGSVFFFLGGKTSLLWLTDEFVITVRLFEANENFLFLQFPSMNGDDWEELTTFLINSVRNHLIGDWFWLDWSAVGAKLFIIFCVIFFFIYWFLGVIEGDVGWKDVIFTLHSDRLGVKSFTCCVVS